MKQILVLGAGVIGLSCAVRLARAGARVTVLEGEREDWSAHGPAASLAAAGMLAPVVEALSAEGAHPRLAELCLASFDLWRTQSAGAQWADAIRFEGGVVLAETEDKAASLIARAAAHGREARRLSRADIEKRCGLKTELAGVFVADEGVIDPGRALSALAMEARRFGVRLLFSHDVRDIEPEAGRVICADGALFEADVIVIALGAWADERIAASAPALSIIRPAKGHMAPVEVAGFLSANVHGPGFYIARRGEDDIVLGSTMEFGVHDRRVDKAKIASLLAAAERTLPGQVTLRTDAFAWAGVRPMSPDEAPLIGPSGAPNVLVAAGHSRNGWLNAPITAEIICAHVYGEAISPLWAAFDPDRFEKVQ